jgi:hypothetical protein
MGDSTELQIVDEVVFLRRKEEEISISKRNIESNQVVSHVVHGPVLGGIQAPAIPTYFD